MIYSALTEILLSLLTNSSSGALTHPLNSTRDTCKSCIWTLAGASRFPLRQTERTGWKSSHHDHHHSRHQKRKRKLEWKRKEANFRRPPPPARPWCRLTYSFRAAGKINVVFVSIVSSLCSSSSSLCACLLIQEWSQEGRNTKIRRMIPSSHFQPAPPCALGDTILALL